MSLFDDAQWLPVAFAPLSVRFGDRLVLRRENDAVWWGYEGLSATVELGPDGRLDATFIERPSVDGVSERLVAPLYRREGLGYALSAESCARMAADLSDFFSGVREPRFTFAGTCLL